MQYYVIGPDGNKYGPADVPTLKQWVAENRLGEQSMLEDFSSGQRLQAGQVPGLFGEAPTMAAPPSAGPAMGSASGTAYQQPTPGGYPRANSQSGDDGNTFIILGWIFAVFGLVVCCVYFAQFAAILAVAFAFIAGSKGHRGAKALKVFSIISLVISLVSFILLSMYAEDLKAWADRVKAQQQAQQQGR